MTTTAAARLTSPGAAASERQALEDRLSSDTEKIVRRFLLSVESRARSAVYSGALVAAAGLPEPVTLGSVMGAWADAAGAFVKVFRTRAPVAAADPAYIDKVLTRLRTLPIAEEAFDAVREAIQSGLDQRLGARDIASMVSDQLSYDVVTDADVEKIPWASRVQTIARTEATGAFNYTNLQTVKETDRFRRKRWVAHHDERTRPTHAVADGQTVSVNGNFIVGDSLMQQPGDPAGPAAEVARCRCVVVGVEESRERRTTT